MQVSPITTPVPWSIVNNRLWRLPDECRCRFRWRHFGDDTRNERHAEYQQLMRYAVVTDGADGGIAADNLAERMGGRVTVVSGFDVGCQYTA